jgi:hypothetical protein
VAAADENFVGGTCVVHVDLHKKPRHTYWAEAAVNDARGWTVARLGRSELHAQYAVQGHMPLALLISGGNDGTMHFAYGGHTWDQKARNCRVGGWHKDVRRMNCNFQC